MSDADKVGAEVDPVEKAVEYRNHLKEELASVEAFIAMAQELSSPRKLAELDFWLWDETEAPVTLH